MSYQPIGFEPKPGDEPSPPRYINQPSWISRNGCWFIPLIGSFVLIPLVCCAGGFFFMWSFLGAPRDAALEVVRNDARVVQELGTPIEADSSVSSQNFSFQNGNGSGEIKFRVSGPKGSASVDGRLTVKDNIWTADAITVTTDSGVTIDIPEDSGDRERIPDADGFDF